LVNIRTIKIQKSAYYISMLILVIFVLIFLYKMLGLGAVITGIEDLIKSEKLLKATLDYGCPYIGITNSEFIDSKPSELISTIFYMLSDLDFGEPMSLISAQMPFFNTVETKSVMTPGIEIPHLEEVIPEYDLPEYQIDIKNQKKEEPNRNTKYSERDLNTEPYILIYHSHSTEAYSPSVKDVFSQKEYPYHDKNLDKTVVRIGEELKKHLEDKHNIKVIHDKTMNDIPSYTMSYTNSLKTVKKNLDEYPTIEIAIDLHRDAPHIDRCKSREATTVNINGKEAARIMFVVGTDKLFEHPNWKKNYQFVLAIQQNMDNLYEGLSRKIDLRNERFNQHLLDKSVLVEIGSHGNTLEEALFSAELLAAVLSKVIRNFP